MDTPSVLALLRSRGLAVRVVAGRLRVGPADRLDDALRALVRQHKAALVALLSPPLPADRRPDAGRSKTVSADEYRAAVAELGAWNRQVLARSRGAEPAQRAKLAPSPPPMTFEDS